MSRDLRLTGSLRGQTDKPVAPPGFEVNNPWKVKNPRGTSMIVSSFECRLLMLRAGGEKILLKSVLRHSINFCSINTNRDVQFIIPGSQAIQAMGH
jgi:hypothetical protein